MSAQNSAGIQTLLDAERDASKIVQKGQSMYISLRTSVSEINTDWSGSEQPVNVHRTKRVKEARDEAKKEIEEYRQSKEAEYKKFESQHSAGNKQAEDDANKEADAKISEIKAAGQKNQDKVVKDLLKAVFDVKPVPPAAA
ncbi:hypothetical protein BN1723_004248 [Verticillium longisporum]|uniref:V-type proton ATPase subunit G n=1 Tax=Verticillium longisporum TaxID=100787 RepID=A0A0G4MQ76_VERLO|nr:hypothetical protein BN1708_015398 [Verticillium longisporum]CRK36391.1 hypothetical protein BN1723_004248 [Verticillium longisporum]